jgi:UDP-galactopyranose mutase
MSYDYLIVGAGFFGSICAYELNKIGKKVLVIDVRNHIGGNCYSENRDNINLHVYGPHIFHTSDEEVWKWINQFTSFNNFIYTPVANYNGKLYSLPFNMWTFYQLWGVQSEEEVKAIIAKQSAHIGEPKNLEEQAIKLVGKDVYEALIKGYTEKQWRKKATELPKEIIKRLPVRYTFNNNYFNDKYQGIPIGGYTKIFEKLLKGIEVRTGVDYFKDDLPTHNKVIFTGPIDKFYGYKHGYLEYKTVELDHMRMETPNYQGVAAINYTSDKVPFTRTIEHKHFENSQSDVTWVSWETPIQYVPEKTEPYYPVNDSANMEILKKYKEEAAKQNKVVFGGRLGEYKYYDMHQVIRSALDCANHIKYMEVWHPNL